MAKRRVHGELHIYDKVTDTTVPGLKGKFIKGPIPAKWLVDASAASGTALAMGLVIWWLAGLKGRKNDLLIGNRGLIACFGITPSIKSRALKSLERAGLISVQREPGLLPVVAILDKQGNLK